MNTKLSSKFWLNLFKKNFNRGFTLTELAIVITVTGFLPALVMPFYLNHHNLLQNQTIVKK